MADTEKVEIELTPAQTEAKRRFRKFPTFQRKAFIDIGTFFNAMKAFNEDREQGTLEEERALFAWLISSFLSTKSPPTEAFLHPDLPSGEKRHSPSGLNMDEFMKQADVDITAVPSGVTTKGEDLSAMLSDLVERSAEVYEGWEPQKEDSGI